MTRPDGLAVDVSRETMARLETYEALLRKWNRRINLVGPGTLTDFQERHIRDSLQLLGVAPNALRWVDFGSGGGLPGLPLAIALSERATEAQIHLIESDQRKAAFLREAARITEAPVTVHGRRIEAVAPFAADVVTARALAPLAKLLEYAAPWMRLGAIGVFPKGENAEQELTVAKQRWTFDHHLIPSRTHLGGVIVVITEAHDGAID